MTVFIMVADALAPADNSPSHSRVVSIVAADAHPPAGLHATVILT